MSRKKGKRYVFGKTATDHKEAKQKRSGRDRV